LVWGDYSDRCTDRAPLVIPAYFEVNPTMCEGHGQCNAVAPEVYDLDDGGYCVINSSEVPRDLESQAEQGALACPMLAITIIR
jgi:ferredoxin